MSPAIRISIGVAAMSVCLVFLADLLFDIFPETANPQLEARKTASQALGMEFASIAAEDTQTQFLPAMNRALMRHDQLLSLGLRDTTGGLVAHTADHELLWKPESEERSTPTHVRIPIFRNGQPWGTLEARFEQLTAMGAMDLLQSPLYRLAATMGILGFVSYLLYLSRTLRYLDPGSVIPGRVRSALDQLVEGAMILDDSQRIVLANKAFADKVGQDADDLLGVDPSSFDWLTDVASTLNELPWVSVERTGERFRNARLQLRTPALGIRTLSANASPISDGGGRLRGMLVTFDDISETERMNQELQATVLELETTQAELRRKNVELEALATVDPLTGCLNRRALFDKLSKEVRLARHNGTQVSVLMADIDHFKGINDDFGHAVGDEVIKAMADALNGFCPKNGAVGRYGGEEFCMVLVNTDAESAAVVADQIRVAFHETLSMEHSPTSGRKVTASFGVAVLSQDVEDVAALVNQADVALYESKRSGRNRVSIWRDAGTLKEGLG